MHIDASQLEVSNNLSAGRFEIWVGDSLAELDYHIRGKKMIITHTGVPPELEGQGIGSRLARTALDYARKNSLEVVSFCSFVSAYIDKERRE